METEVRVVRHDGDIELRALDGGAGAVLTGYAAVYDSPSEDFGGFRERIDRQAFTRTLSHGGDVPVTFNHNLDNLLGRTSSGTAKVWSDERGVRYEVELPDTPVGQTVRALAQRGDLFGGSFSFVVTKGGYRWERDETGKRMRVLTDVKLLELGPVTTPAYSDTTVALRSLADALVEDEETEEVSDVEEAVEVSDEETVEVSEESVDSTTDVVDTDGESDGEGARSVTTSLAVLRARRLPR